MDGGPHAGKPRVSLRSELVRLGMRWFIKRRHHPTVAAARRGILAAARWVPSSPAGTEASRSWARGMPSENFFSAGTTSFLSVRRIFQTK